MKARHATAKLLTRLPSMHAPLPRATATQRTAASSLHPQARLTETLPRPRPGDPPKSCFEDTELSADLFTAPQGYTVRVLPAPASLRITPASLRGAGPSAVWQKPWFFIQTVGRETKPEFTASELQARAFGVKMLNWIQLITTPTADTQGTCLLLHFDKQRYVFGNISEGTQRAMVQRKVGLHKTEDIFLSGPVDWHNAGGLIGMILTLADVIGTTKEALNAENAARKKKGRKLVEDTVLSRLNIHGGKNLSQLLATSRRFVFRKGLPLNPVEVRDDPRASKQGAEPDWQDSNIKVWYMPVDAKADQESQPSRKRSHDEISDSDSTTPKSSKEDDQRQVLEIVTQMFNSKWKMDALVETTLYEANLPAKLFVRDDKGHIQVYKGPMPGDEGEVPDIPVLVRQPWPAALYLTLPWTEPSKQSMCYVVKGHDRRGKFNPKLAEKYGVAKQDYKKLTAGQNVTVNDIVVTPEMVLGETIPGLGFAVLDVPNTSYIEALINRPEFSSEELMDGIVVAFWLLGPGVINDPQLQAFMEKTPSLRHVICSGDSSPNMISLESAATQNYKLHCIDPDRFPLLDFNNGAPVSQVPMGPLPESLEIGRTGKMIQFSPQFMHKDDQIVPFPNVKKLAETDKVPGVKELANIARQKCGDPTFLAKIQQVESDIPSRDAEVITLGTGSALPSKYRNVSATLVRVPGFGNYLFDAGENTMGQLRRTFGSELPSVLRDLKVIWISHLHADHHLGTAGVIKAWNEETLQSNPSAKLHVASHMHMIDWLREYASIETYGFSRLTFTQFSQYDANTRICKSRPFDAEQVEAYGLEKIEACYVEHCHGALATVFTWPSGLKVAYSGDCRPSDSFVQIGQGTTLLIHESTFDDELKGDAIAKKHSTMSEAIDVGRRMGARRIMLTHFSQRYQKIPSLEENLEIKADVGSEEKAKLDEVILVAFDYMRVKLGEFRKAQAFLPAIQKLFENVGEQ
ncbi:hypothetical protein JX265_002702 [Neoarthrinium moseri]|uniref:ribonuclease Z n=1 Tax=Neoarthrinium moseri TaxID=1658444 RepID=A0A9Q0AUJ4_9PEZI|nr:hypothetical protein JX266_011154 [Neoarthrinium moseri]KAI1879748.1 hypothetical protein JX265_002702 [Neoarthrinium moseri]